MRVMERVLTPDTLLAVVARRLVEFWPALGGDRRETAWRDVGAYAMHVFARLPLNAWTTELGSTLPRVSGLVVSGAPRRTNICDTRWSARASGFPSTALEEWNWRHRGRRMSPLRPIAFVMSHQCEHGWRLSGHRVSFDTMRPRASRTLWWQALTTRACASLSVWGGGASLQARARTTVRLEVRFRPRRSAMPSARSLVAAAMPKVL